MESPGAHVTIFRSRLAAACRERSLVLKAMSIEHAVLRRGREWSLVVPEHRAPAALRQLDDYERETRDWPARHAALPRHPLSLSGVAACVLVLLVVAAADGRMALGLDWFGAGRIDADLIRHGEWWRTVTALTLHVDVPHLIGNLLLGSILGVIAGRLLGNGLAWFSIVVAGAVGNGVSAVVQLPGHTAVGASTAVFAALGLVTAYVWRRRHELPGRWAVRWAPVVVGVVLLAYLGSGNERTDVVSHLTGFLVGIGLGVWYGGTTLAIRLGPRSQWLLGLGALVIVAGAWAIALGAHG